MKIQFTLLSAFLLIISGLSQAQTVINTNDNGAGSLRQAILDANANPDTDNISFNIPGTGPHTIQLTSALTEITEPVVIDGYTQSGASPATSSTNAVLMIELDGTNAGSDVAGLKIELNGTNAGDAVDGLIISAGNTTIHR